MFSVTSPTNFYKVNFNDTISNKISKLNEFVLSLEGQVANAKFDVNEISQICTDLSINRKYLRNVYLGHTLATYSSWSHLKAEGGYSIWKYTPTNYKYNSINNLYFDGAVVINEGEANSELATAFDKVFLYDGVSYTDDTTEASTEEGTSFNLMSATDQYFYVGEASTFTGVKFEFYNRGSNYTLVAEYWDGAAWSLLDASGELYTDDTSNFESDGKITWSSPANWATTDVNGTTAYWVRFSTSSTPVTTAQAYYVIPATSVIGLLAMSSTEISNEEWKWCSFNNAIYVTIRNTGVSTYEGDYHIKSSSTQVNLQNFFIYNHAYSCDHEDSTYVASDLSDAISFSESGWTSTTIHDAIIEASTSGEVADGNYTDITISGSGLIYTVNTGAITYAKIQNVSATDKLLGRYSAGAGAIEEIDCTAFARTILDDTNALTARATLGLVIGTNVLAPDGDGSSLTGVLKTLTAGHGIDISGSTVEVDETELQDTLIPFSSSGFTATNIHGAILEVYNNSGASAVSDVAYGASWDTDTTHAPSKNAIYAKIETLAGGHDAVTLNANITSLLGLSTQELSLDIQTANYIFAGPTSGGAAAPTFRALIADDIPDISANIDVSSVPFAHSGFTATNVHDAIIESRVDMSLSDPILDHSYTGITISLPAAETLAFGDVCYIATSGKAHLIDADSINSMSGLFICVESSLAQDVVGTFIVLGTVRDDTWNWTIGGTIYGSTTGTSTNTLTQTAPSGTDDVIQILGVALSSDIIMFKPELVQITHI